MFPFESVDAGMGLLALGFGRMACCGATDGAAVLNMGLGLALPWISRCRPRCCVVIASWRDSGPAKGAMGSKCFEGDPRPQLLADGIFRLRTTEDMPTVSGGEAWPLPSKSPAPPRIVMQCNAAAELFFYAIHVPYRVPYRHETEGATAPNSEKVRWAPVPDRKNNAAASVL